MTDKERKERVRHPSTQIPEDVVTEINFRAYLLRLEPPMTPEESAEQSYEPIAGRGRKVVMDDAYGRRNAVSQIAITRTYLRVLTDMGII